MGSRAGARNPFYGHRHTDEARLRIAEARRGRRHTEETRRRIAESVRMSWESRRGAAAGTSINVEAS
jgi:hypothetical protein